MPLVEKSNLTGWLFDVYPHQRDGLVVWFISEDGQRYRLIQDFPVCFYVGGSQEELRALWIYLRKSHPELHLEKEERKELFEGLIEVLAIRVEKPVLQPRLFRKLHNLFPGLDYYDADLAIPIRYHCAFDLFPLAYSQITLSSPENINSIHSLDDRWSLQPNIPELRILSIEPEGDPRHSSPSSLKLLYADQSERLPTQDARELLSRLSHLIDTYDPEIIATRFGDQ